MKAGQQLVVFAPGGTMHITCSGARKGWTVCGRLVPRGVHARHVGTPEVLERLLATRESCMNCDRMKDASTT